MALAIAIHAIVLVGFLYLGPAVPFRKEVERRLLAFSLDPETDSPEASEQRQKAAPTPDKKPEAAKPQPAVRPVMPEPPPMPVPTTKLPVIALSRDDMASADIGRMARSSGAPGASAGADSRSAYGPGEGPGGVRLYEAEWYRRPTNAELSGYMPKPMPHNGWGLIACQTIDDFRVDNCQQLDEFPRGSGLSRAVRQAAWQFRVRPPRTGGKPMIGSWVRIRIDYNLVVTAP